MSSGGGWFKPNTEHLWDKVLRDGQEQVRCRLCGCYFGGGGECDRGAERQVFKNNLNKIRGLLKKRG
jgi:hypothetical protein